MPWQSRRCLHHDRRRHLSFLPQKIRSVYEARLRSKMRNALRDSCSLRDYCAGSSSEALFYFYFLFLFFLLLIDTFKYRRNRFEATAEGTVDPHEYDINGALVVLERVGRFEAFSNSKDCVIQSNHM